MLEDEQINAIKMCKINSKTSQKRVKIGKKLTPNVNFIHSCEIKNLQEKQI